MADRKLDDDEDEDDDDDIDAAPAASEDSGADGDEPDFDDDDDEPRRGKGKLIAIIAVAAVVVLAAAGAGFFFVFHDSGDDDAPTADAAPANAEPDDGTSMTIARNRRVMTSEELAKQGGDAQANADATSPAASGGLTPPAANGAANAPAPAAGQAMTPPPAAAAPAALQAPVAAPAPAAKGKGKGTPGPAVPDTPGLVTPATTAAEYRDIPVLPAGKPLSAPDPSFGETVDAGIIPRAKGSQGVWKAYARPFDGPADKPRIAIIITGMGLSRAATLAAISQTPPNVTLAFDPYTRNLDEWLGLGRSNGHEALLQLPMEPNDFPVSDPGPLAMLTDINPQQNLGRLYQIFASAIGYTGVIQVLGSKFTASEAALRPTLDELRKRGVLFVSNPSGNDDRAFQVAQDVGVPSTRVDLKLDSDPSAGAIDARLADLERIAREKGRAVAIAEPYPVTLARLSAWGQGLQIKELFLAPASAVAQVGAPAPAAAKGAAKH